MTDIELPSRLSYSSRSAYAECGERWRLERLHKVPSESWYATVAGTAVHEITELIDRQEIGAYKGAIPEFKEIFDREIQKAEDEGILLRVSGSKRVKLCIDGGPNKRDYDWWLKYGPEMIENWSTWKAEAGWTLATLPDGTPGIEVPLYSQMAGKDFLGYIDRLYVYPNGDLVIIDLKSGNVPASTSQLGDYKVALQRTYGLTAEWGAYWMGTTGTLHSLTYLGEYTEELVEHQYAMTWAGIEAGVFLPNITSMCRSCGVRAYCRAKGGELSKQIPLVSLDTRSGTVLSGQGG